VCGGVRDGVSEYFMEDFVGKAVYRRVVVGHRGLFMFEGRLGNSVVGVKGFLDCVTEPVESAVEGA